MGTRSTPAPPKDRIRGSSLSAPGSAAVGAGVPIRLPKATAEALRKKAAALNQGQPAGRKTTARVLAAVWRRGAGAYSVSHRPGVSRSAWAMARVNAFVHLLKTGKPKNANYVQDNDLLPRDHPRKSKRRNIRWWELPEDMWDEELERMQRDKARGIANLRASIGKRLRKGDVFATPNGFPRNGYTIVHRSTKQKPGVKYQLTWMDDDGPMGDTEPKTLSDAAHRIWEDLTNAQKQAWIDVRETLRNSPPQVRLQYVDAATGLPRAPKEAGTVATGEFVAKIGGVEVVVDREELVGFSREADPRKRTFGLDPEVLPIYEGMAKRQRSESRKGTGKISCPPRIRGLRLTYKSPTAAAKTFYEENADFFDAVRDPADGLRDWMDGVETGRGKRSKKLAKTATGARILTAPMGEPQIKRALAYIFGRNRSRRWDKVDWFTIDKLGASLEPYYEPYGGTRPSRPGLYWRPFAGDIDPAALESLDPEDREKYTACDAQTEIRETVEALRKTYRKNRKCIPPRARMTVLRRIREWSTWARDPRMIPAYACAPDPSTGGMTCDYPAVAQELRELRKACETGYDPDWPEGLARAGTPGYPDASAGEVDTAGKAGAVVMRVAPKPAPLKKGKTKIQQCASLMGQRGAAARKRKKKSKSKRNRAPARYDQDVFIEPPAEAKRIAKMALELRAMLPKSRQCCTRVGIARAQSIARGEPQPAREVRDWFRRHGQGIEKAKAEGKDAANSKRLQAAAFWGGAPMQQAAEKAAKGDPMRKLAERAVARARNADRLLGSRSGGPSSIKLRVKRVPQAGFFVRAYDGSKKVGQLAVVETLNTMVVDKAFVLEDYRGQGIGRAMYRKAAQVSCDLYRKPLASQSWAASPASRGLWKSELAAGLVERTIDGFSYRCPVSNPVQSGAGS